MAIDLLFKGSKSAASLDPKLIYDLSLDRAIEALKGVDKKDCVYFLDALRSPCTDIESIEYRRAILNDLKNFSVVFNRLNDLFSHFSELKEAQKNIEKDVTRLQSDGRDSISSARAIMCANAISLKRALAFIRSFYDVLSSEQLESEGLIGFRNACGEICEKDEYKKLCMLCAKYENYSTSGFMDFRFKLADGRVESYSLIDHRFVKLPGPDQKKKGFALFKKSEPEEDIACAELNPARGDGYESLNTTALSELSRAFRTAVDSVFDEFLPLGRQLAFYRIACALVNSYEEEGIKYAYPAFTGDRKIADLYDTYLLLTKNSDEIIPNSLDGGMGTVIIGGNGSGKTVFMRSVATAQILAQSGLPIPAKSAGLTLYSAFASSFSEGEHEPDESLAAGRFEEEVRALAEMVDKLPRDSLVLLNEVFQSTAYAEGAEGLFHLLNYFTDSGIVWMLVTHLTDLPARFADDGRVAVMKTAENYKIIEHRPRISE